MRWRWMTRTLGAATSSIAVSHHLQLPAQEVQPFLHAGAGLERRAVEQAFAEKLLRRGFHVLPPLRRAPVARARGEVAAGRLKSLAVHGPNILLAEAGVKQYCSIRHSRAGASFPVD